MTNLLGRNGRRRRVLNEEALSASTAHLAWRSDAQREPSASAPRYSEAAGVEHHAQVTDFLPRRYRTLAVWALVGVGSTMALAALDWFAVPAAGGYAPGVAAALELGALGGIGTWLSAVVLLLTAAACLLVYSLRRHRIDDYRGRYRIWLAAAGASALLSINGVAPLDRLLAAAAAHHSGWTALRDNAVWWLIIGCLPLAWIAMRAWLDARESRLAAAVLAVAFASYALATTSFLAGWPVSDPRVESLVTAGSALVGHWMLLIGVVSYGRFVVLDAQGLVPAAARRRKNSRHEKAQETSNVDRHSTTVGGRRSDLDASAADNSLRAFRQRLKEDGRPTPAAAGSARWVDGREPVDDDFNDDDADPRDRKLSKAQRKQLRKLKAQQRAA